MSNICPDEIDVFLAQTAAAHGVSPTETFPFQVRGVFGPVDMHITVAPTNSPHGMGQTIAITEQIRRDVVSGMVAGFYASTDLVSVVTLGNARTHSHWISADGSATAHIDRWGLKSGSVLSLPNP